MLATAKALYSSLTPMRKVGKGQENVVKISKTNFSDVVRRFRVTFPHALSAEFSYLWPIAAAMHQQKG